MEGHSRRASISVDFLDRDDFTRDRRKTRRVASRPQKMIDASAGFSLTLVFRALLHFDPHR